MTKRILLGGLGGGFTLFLWGFLSHTVFQLGDAGMSTVEAGQSDALVVATKAAFKESGLYFFPHFDHAATSKLPKDQQEAVWKAYGERIKSGPSGIIVFKSADAPMMSGAQLGRQFGTDVLVALILALVVSQLHERSKFTFRMLCCSLLGLLCGLAINVPYWNWYNFPGTFTVAQIADHILGFTLAGAFLAWLFKPAASPAPAPAPAQA
ncbi:MAG: hypothetical protein ABMA26_08520 [Limisphaerales bacterium]